MRNRGGSKYVDEDRTKKCKICEQNSEIPHEFTNPEPSLPNSSHRPNHHSQWFSDINTLTQITVLDVMY